MTALTRQALAAARLLLLLTLVLGLAYPLAVYGAGRLVPGRADGSLVRVDGRVVGSELLGQSAPGAIWFHPRPSVAGAGYDPLASGGSNLGPNSARLLHAVAARRSAVAAANGVPRSSVPPDALTASASGLDPHISPAYARLQVRRVAAARGLPVPAVARLVEDHVRGPALGFLGGPRVNVLELNIALTGLGHGGG